MIDFIEVLSKEEIISLSLRALYAKHGYEMYKMSKFEEYDLYAKNKNFLVSESVITFTDTDGRLLALKPDVTLSIVKNGKDEGGLTKVYYDEKVYRQDKGTKAFREIMQSGVEVQGEITDELKAETVSLAVKSLCVISPSCVLALSSLSVIDAIFEDAGVSEGAKKELTELLSRKNAHALKEAAIADGVSESNAQKLFELASIYGKSDKALAMLDGFRSERTANAIGEMESVIGLLEESVKDKIVIDFSVTGNANYYNGLTFNGYISGVPTEVLKGGQYDNLMKRMKRRAKAVGFAVYLDELGRL